MDGFTGWLKTFLLTQGLNVVWALVILGVGWWVAKRLRVWIAKLMRKGGMDETLVTFLNSLIYITVLVFVGVAALNQVGFATTSIIAILGAAGLAVALSLQGSLANLAAGVIVIITRPFKVGDAVEAAGVFGTVQRMSILSTQLKSPDGKMIHIPNAKLVGDNLINYSSSETRRVDLVIGVGYGDDLAKAKEVLNKALADEPLVLDDPPATVAVSELADNSVNFVVRPWVKNADHWDVYYGLTESIKLRLDEAGISIPYPQRDMHLVSGWPKQDD